MAMNADKAGDAFRTIGELSADLGVPQHILRYWETRFPQLRPLQRAGNRRYYRPGDVALVQRIDRLLNREGYTIRGVQQLLAGRANGEAAPIPDAASLAGEDMLRELRAIRDDLVRAIEQDLAAAGQV